MHTKQHLKKELAMLVIGGKLRRKRIISDIFEESTLRLTFVEKEDILNRKLGQRYDLYCRPPRIGKRWKDYRSYDNCLLNSPWQQNCALVSLQYFSCILWFC